MKSLAKLLLLSTLWLASSAFAFFDQCKDLFPAQQVPSTTQLGRDLCFDDFAIYYSPSDKKPIYTVERLNGEQLQAPHPRRTNQFYEEARLPWNERALLTDYRGSGYDRGHNQNPPKNILNIYYNRFTMSIYTLYAYSEYP